eukprot:11171707-Karenia_brevis.AAC.1
MPLDVQRDAMKDLLRNPGDVCGEQELLDPNLHAGSIDLLLTNVAKVILHNDLRKAKHLLHKLPLARKFLSVDSAGLHLINATAFADQLAANRCTVLENQLAAN